MTHILEISHLSKSFGALKVADDISLEVPPGRALGIIGPNGAGKSTLFNLIAGNLTAESGTICLNGRDITGLPARARVKLGIGRTFQIPQPFEKLTVLENLLVASHFGRAAQEPYTEEACVAILRRTGLLDRVNQLSGSLSLLDRKRLELARAMATGPDLLLLDEIAGGLTQGECKALIATIRALLSGGTTIIWIEHVLHALTSVVDRLAVLDFGRLIEEGAPAEVMASRAVKEIYLGREV